jgi:predicted metal-binding membrane protein
MMWMPMPGQSWAGAAAVFVLAWTAMMVPMMLPSLAPALWRYRRAAIQSGGPHAALRTAVAGATYLLVWAPARFPPSAARCSSQPVGSR